MTRLIPTIALLLALIGCAGKGITNTSSVVAAADALIGRCETTDCQYQRACEVTGALIGMKALGYTEDPGGDYGRAVFLHQATVRLYEARNTPYPNTGLGVYSLRIAEVVKADAEVKIASFGLTDLSKLVVRVLAKREYGVRRLQDATAHMEAVDAGKPLDVAWGECIGQMERDLGALRELGGVPAGS
jgi:hypothetical protein